MQGSPPRTVSPSTELHSVLLNELRRTPSAILEPTLTLERDSIGGTHLINVHEPRASADSGEEEEVDKGVRVYRALIEEAVQDNSYELRLDFDKMSFVYVYRRVVYEGGDGFYETLHRGSFSKEMSGAKRGGGGSGVMKRSSKKNSTGSSPPTSAREPTVYFLCKVEGRDFESDWQPWDKRQPSERVVRKGDTFHQELLFRLNSTNFEVWNDNVAPSFIMSTKTQL